CCSDPTHSGCARDVFEGAAGVVKQRVFLTGERIDKNIGLTVIVVIGEVETHPGECEAVLIVGQPGRNADVFEGAVAAVQEELLRERIVGNQNVGPAVIIEIMDSDTESLARSRGETSR